VDRLYPEKEEEVTEREIHAIKQMQDQKQESIHLQRTGDLSRMEKVLVALAAEEGGTVLKEVERRIGRERMSKTMRRILDCGSRSGGMERSSDGTEIDRMANEEAVKVIEELRQKGVRSLIEDAERESGRAYAAMKEMVEKRDTERVVAACCEEMIDERRSSVREKAVVNGNASDLIKQLFT
jgi:hypothetical protein